MVRYYLLILVGAFTQLVLTIVNTKGVFKTL